MQASHTSPDGELDGLDLTKTKVTDAGLARLAAFKSLSRLWLTGTQASDTGLKHLYELKRLRYLALDETKVTQKGIQELKRALPEVETGDRRGKKR